MRAKDTYYYNFHRLAFVMGAVNHKKHKQMFYKMYVTCNLSGRQICVLSKSKYSSIFNVS